MAKITKKIEMNEKELLSLLASHFKLKQNGAKINIYKYDGDAREPSYVSVTIEGEESE